VLGGIIECFGGAAVGLGIFGRIAAAGIAGDMAMAMATVTWANGISSTKTGGGYELNLALCVLAVMVALLGTGRFSLDQAIKALWEKRHSGTQRYC
jgi:putative oxidoreductase